MSATRRASRASSFEQQPREPVRNVPGADESASERDADGEQALVRLARRQLHDASWHEHGLPGHPAHGYSITREIEQRSDGVFAIEDAALYKALHRLEAAGAVEAEWGVS